jgi:hypothetical protein
MRNEKEMYASLLSIIACKHRLHIRLAELIDDLFAVNHFTGATRSSTFIHMQTFGISKPFVYLLLPILVKFICCTEARTSLDCVVVCKSQTAHAIGISDLSAFVHSMVIE